MVKKQEIATSQLMVNYSSKYFLLVEISQKETMNTIAIWNLIQLLK
ncbi:MAG: hypothetical protein FWH54_07070 [Methanobrevibacter sp.]|nr:hypothetical protein [Methanobrevibacter sp.]